MLIQLSFACSVVCCRGGAHSRATEVTDRPVEQAVPLAGPTLQLESLPSPYKRRVRERGSGRATLRGMALPEYDDRRLFFFPLMSVCFHSVT